MSCLCHHWSHGPIGVLYLTLRQHCGLLCYHHTHRLTLSRFSLTMSCITSGDEDDGAASSGLTIDGDILSSLLEMKRVGKGAQRVTPSIQPSFRPARECGTPSRRCMGANRAPTYVPSAGSRKHEPPGLHSHLDQCLGLQVQERERRERESYGKPKKA